MFTRLGLLFLICSCAITANALAADGITTGQSHFAKLDGTGIHYTDYGTGSSALVFVHGWACNETVWRGQAAELGEKIRAITIDLPGHGQSDQPDISYTMDYYARAIDAVLADARVEAAVLVGHSNGTPVVREYYRKYPAKVRALVIVDGPLRQFFDAAAMQKFIGPFRDNYKEAAGKMIDGITRPMKSDTSRAEIKTVMLSTPPKVAISEFENTENPDLWKPDKINVPVLMIMAKQPAWSAEYEQFVRRLISDLDYRVWEDVSHFLMVDKPHEFNDAVLEFLDKRGLLPKNS